MLKAAQFTDLRLQTDHHGDGAGAGDAGQGQREEGRVGVLGLGYFRHLGLAVQHAVAEQADDHAARHAHGTVRDAEGFHDDAAHEQRAHQNAEAVDGGLGGGAPGGVGIHADGDRGEDGQRGRRVHDGEKADKGPQQKRGKTLASHHSPTHQTYEARLSGARPVVASAGEGVLC